jgi:CheY-like chemotaxis protein
MSSAEMGGMGWLESFTPASIRKVERWRDRSVDRAEWEEELQLKDCRGALRTILFHGQRVQGNNLSSDLWAFVYLDITDRRTQLKSEKEACEFAEAIIRTLPIPIAVIHSSHRIIAANPAFHGLLNKFNTSIHGELIHGLCTGCSENLVLAIDDLIKQEMPFDNVSMRLATIDKHSPNLIVSGRRLVIPGHDGPMALLSFALPSAKSNSRETYSYGASLDGVDGSETERLRVLVVDDSESDAFLLSHVLSVMGHHVNVVHNARDALRQVSSFSPQLVITDIVMPDMDGLELARQIRSQSSRESIALVALTGHSSTIFGDEPLALHFDEILVKPIEIVELQALVERIGNRW